MNEENIHLSVYMSDETVHLSVYVYDRSSTKTPAEVGTLNLNDVAIVRQISE